MRRAAFAALAPALACAQQAGTKTQEQHPQLPTQTCTKAGGCQTEQTMVTVDSNWRWIDKDGTNCYTGQNWDTTICPDPVTCAQNCAVEGAGAEYKSTYGVNTAGNGLTLNFVTQGPYSKNVGSRNYLMADESHYKMFNLKNKEFTFDVDVSKLGCGLNGAVYFVAMDADGGMSKFPGNKAGAKYGVGYCDAQCPHDLKFINGEANMASWSPNPKDPNAGTGKYGACCTEMDIWEANSISTAFTPHACTGTGYTRCEGIDCGDGNPSMGPVPGHRFDGLCDKNGCDLQTYRMGHKTYYGPGSQFDVDTTKTMTVVTQFITADGTDGGALKEIRRFYVQGGKAIPTPKLDVGGTAFDSVSDEYCKAEVELYKDNTNFLQKGGMGAMDKAMEQGMVLVMSLWDDHDVNMLWLDSTYPTNGTCEQGACRGTCATSSGDPKTIESSNADAHYKISNIKVGELGSTTSAHPGPAPAPGPSPPTPPTPPSPSGCPGGSLSACMGLCPSSPPAAYKACVNNCVARC